jgi:hypothetical protein
MRRIVEPSEPLENDQLLAQEAEVLRLSQAGGQMILRIRGLRAQSGDYRLSPADRRRCMQAADAQEDAMAKHIEIQRDAELELEELRKNC